MASGLILVSGARPARASHFHHRMESARSGSWTGTTPTESFQQALKDFLTTWHDKTKPPAAMPTSGMTYPAAEYLPPPAPSVRNWHQTQAVASTPPIPPPPCSGGTSMAGGTSPATLSVPSALLGSTTPAPEPSTIVSALAFVGAFAWRHRRRA